MKTSVSKLNPKLWEWTVTKPATGERLAGGLCRTKADALNDAKAWVAQVEDREARAAGRIVKGDAIAILPEWQDDGDEHYDVFACHTELEGMTWLQTRAIDRRTGEPSIGTQSLFLAYVDRAATATLRQP